MSRIEQVSDHPGTPLSARERKLIRALHRRKEREARGRFLAEGVRVVEDLLASALETELVAAVSTAEDDPRLAALLAAALAAGVPVRRAAEREIAALAGTESPQGVVAVARTPRSTLGRLAPARAASCLLILDAVQDPGNFGTLARTAEALGADGVVALPGTVDAWNPKAVRAAVGSTFRAPVVQAAWPELEAWLRGHGYAVLAADAAGAPPAAEPPARAALVVGNEGAGISPETRARADTLVGIPIRGRAESLNVSAAAAILLHQLVR